MPTRDYEIILTLRGREKFHNWASKDFDTITELNQFIFFEIQRNLLNATLEVLQINNISIADYLEA